VIHKIVPGQFIEGGKIRNAVKEPLPGSVYVNTGEIPSNPELLDLSTSGLKHDSPGLLSVEQDGLQFTLTTGPAEELDGANRIIGRVLEGMPILERIQKVPIVEPTGDKKLFVSVGKAIGDARAKSNAFYKPLAKVRISDSGTL